MMKLTTDEKQSFIGPALVGCTLGVLVAFAQFAFASEYAPHGEGEWSAVAIDAAVGFAMSVAGSVGVLAVLPMLARRAFAKDSEDV
ncbi:MAG: hypothetical protein RLZZ618_2153 [Pseudomonadota bacterium]|jgi:hypothetical protein